MILISIFSRPASFDHVSEIVTLHVRQYIAERFDFFEMFHLEALAERVPLTSIFQNMTLIYHVQRPANVKRIAKFNLPSVYFFYFLSVKTLVCLCKYTKQLRPLGIFVFDLRHRNHMVINDVCRPYIAT